VNVHSSIGDGKMPGCGFLARALSLLNERDYGQC